MTLKNAIELSNTRARIARLEARYEELRRQTGGDEQVRGLTMRSLKHYVKQFKEEIGRYEAHQPARR